MVHVSRVQLYRGNEETQMREKFRPPEELITDDIIEDMETTQNYEEPVDEILIDNPIPTGRPPQPAVPMPAGLPSTPATEKPSVNQPSPGTSGRTPQQKRTQDSSPSLERKKPHLRGEKRRRERATDDSADNTKRGAKFSNKENIPVRRSRQEKFRDLIMSSETEDELTSTELSGIDTSSEEEVKRIQISEIEIQLLADSITPTKGTDGSAGWDLKANQSVTIQPGRRAKIDLGMKAAIPHQHCGLLVSRSKLASEGIIIVGGLIDSDYRGPWLAILQNLSQEPRRILKGERICQLLLLPVNPAQWNKVTNLQSTNRDEHGFGSTGRY